MRENEKGAILLYYILENFYTIDEAHKAKLYAFMVKLMESEVYLSSMVTVAYSNLIGDRFRPFYEGW